MLFSNPNHPKIMKTTVAVLLLTFLVSSFRLTGQEDLMDLIGDTKPTTEYTYATFKSTRISLGQSVENPPEGNLIFDVQHHLGSMTFSASTRPSRGLDFNMGLPIG